MDQRQKKHAARQGLENLWMSDKTHAAARKGLEDFVADERHGKTLLEAD